MEKKSPKIHEKAVVMPGARVWGDVTVEKDASLWYNAVLRGDEGAIRIGARSNLQDNVVVHSNDEFVASVGEDCTVGHSAILHGCTIGDRVMVGMGSIVMNRAVIGDDCIIGAGSLVTQGTVIPPGSMVFGRPARVVRPLRPEERDSLLEAAEGYVRNSKDHIGEE